MTGKLPVWSVVVLLVTLMSFLKTRLKRTWDLMVGLCSERDDVSGINVGRTGFLDRIF